MKRLTIIGFTLFLTACLAWGNGPVEVSRDLINVGEIWEGEPVTLTIQIRNRSQDTVELGKIQSGCSCVATKPSGDTIMPGKHTDLDIKLVRNKPGKFNEFVIVQGHAKGAEPVPFKQRIAIDGRARPTYTVRGAWQLANQAPSATMQPFKLTKTCKLSMWDLAEQRKLVVHLNGARPDDPAVRATPVAVDSAFFRLSEHNVRAHGAGKLQAVFVLEPKKKWDQGLYYDILRFKLGPDLQVARKISFRLIGPVWSEKATVNFGRVRTQSPSPRKVLLHFQTQETVWSDIHVIKTEPESFGRAVSVTGVKAKGRDLEATLELDPAGLSGTDGFFNFRLYLGDKAVPLDKEPTKAPQTVKLNVYGMATRQSK